MKPGVVLHTPGIARWLPAIASRLPDAAVTSLADCSDPDAVLAALVWDPPPGALRRFRNLRLIQSFGHGVDALVGDGTLPSVPVARLVDPALGRSIARYVLHAVLHHLLEVDRYRDAQATGRWKPLRPRFPSEFPMVVLGYGVIGKEIALLAETAGFDVKGWSRTIKENASHPVFHGRDGLAKAVEGAKVVVNVLPHTPETENLCDEEFFGLFGGEDSLFINVGRGATVDEDALVLTLDAGRLGRAVLDVTREEPLPPVSPLWAHPRVTLTPHVSGPTEIESAADLLVANLRRALDGEPPRNVVDRDRGY